MISPKVRNDFPLLNQGLGGKPVVYMDSACMGLKPLVVVEKVMDYYTKMSACAGRSNHRLAKAVSKGVAEAREAVRRFFGAREAEEIIFTRNTTEGINLVAMTMDFKAGEVVVIGDKEHNSNLIPWLKLKQTKGIELVVVRSNDDNTGDGEAWEKVLVEKKVRLVSLGMTSNLDGVTMPVEQIIRWAHRAGAWVLVDAAQTAPHQPLAVQKLDVDFLAFSGHKLGGPTGMGGLYGKRDRLERLDSFMVGGDTVAHSTYETFEMLPIPERFEAGLQDYAGIIGLGAAVKYLQTIGLKAVHDHEIQLNRIITQGIKSLPQLKIIGPEDASLRGGIVSFYVPGVEAHQIALILDESYRIMVRSGQHCVHSWFADRKIPGSVRASLAFYNTVEEAELLVEAIKETLTVLG